MYKTCGEVANVTRPLIFKIGESGVSQTTPSDKLAYLYDGTGSLDNASCILTELPWNQLPSNVRGSTSPIVYEIQDCRMISIGDVVLINPSGLVNVLYRRSSIHNDLFVTNRCNSKCLMCPQPSTTLDDSHLVDICTELIPLMDQDTEVVGITGGEPTLIGSRLFDLVNLLRIHLPRTCVHILTNGRVCSDAQFCDELSYCGHSNVVMGIPVYGDNAEDHDYVVQSTGAFDETARGIHQLNIRGITVELRIVMMAPVIHRLQRLAEYIWYNFPFVSDVCFMGYEPVGMAWKNRSALWIDPYDYRDALMESVDYLSQRGINVSIYNEQLCIVDTAYHRFVKKSISDWKNVYLDECAGCGLRHECGGFFHSSRRLHSNHIKSL